MSFFSKLIDTLFGTNLTDESSDEWSAQDTAAAERRARQQEPIGWPSADEAFLSISVLPAGGDVSNVPPEIAAEIREAAQLAKKRHDEIDAGYRFQKVPSSGAPTDPRSDDANSKENGGREALDALSNPLFDAAYYECKPRAFTDRLRQGVREVYGGDAVPFYRAAGISRSAYSRLISHPERRPSKDTALAMAAALKLDERGAEAFLELAGYALSPSYPDDAVWRVCFRRGIHDLATIHALIDRV